MADVFISYAKADRQVTEQLARELQAKGLTVWWDKELVAGESFRRVILAELDKARAAIVVWTRAAVRSDWVIAEASRAQARKILIPVRQADVGLDDIPMPFGILHTDLVTNGAAIDAALARLGLTPKAPTTIPIDKPTLIPWWLRIAAGAAIACSVGAGGYIYFRAPPPTPAAITWIQLPVGTHFANFTSTPVATFVQPDLSSESRVSIEPGQTIPPWGVDQPLARATFKGENWVRFPVGNSGEFGYVLERAIKLLPATLSPRRRFLPEGGQGKDLRLRNLSNSIFAA